ncbi:MAG: DUF4199 domain-containing protein [Saprospiraceae bacterium]|nr:DUF4199 domain-containing protein [Saprospiraceae bacterium]
MQRIVLRHGIIAGLILAGALLLSTQFMDAMTDHVLGQVIGYLTMLVALSFIFVGIKRYRDLALEGKITFKRALLVGLYISLIASIFYVATWMIITELILTDWMDQYAVSYLEGLVSNEASEAEIEEGRVLMQRYKEMYENPWKKMGVTFLEIFPVGLLVSLVAALILKRK